MGIQIIPEREPDRFALFSSVSDTFVARDVSAAEVLAFFEEAAVEQTRRSITGIFEQIAAGEKPYHQFTLTLDEAARKDREHR